MVSLNIEKLCPRNVLRSDLRIAWLVGCLYQPTAVRSAHSAKAKAGTFAEKCQKKDYFTLSRNWSVFLTNTLKAVGSPVSVKPFSG